VEVVIGTKKLWPGLTCATLGLMAGLAAGAPGDIDPNYGVNGRAVLPAAVTRVGKVLAVPGDRLVYSMAAGGGIELRRLDAGGGADATFGSSGVTVVSGANGLGAAGAVAPDGKLLFVLSAERTVDGTLRNVETLLRVDANGQPDASFGANRDGLVAIAALPSGPETIVALAAYPDGRVALTGFESSFEDVCGDLVIRRLRADGAEDLAFGSGSPVQLRNPDGDCDSPTLAPQPDGSLLVASGTFVARLTSTGAPDSSFGSSGTRTVGDGLKARVAVLANGGFLAASRYDPSSRGSTYTIRLSRYLASGQADAAFGAGTGRAVIEAGAALTGRTDLMEEVLDVATSRDERQVYLLLDIHSADLPPRPARYACLAVVRASATGVLDAGFGRNGVACLLRGTEGSTPFETLLPREDGSVILDSRYSPGSHLRRLLNDATPSAGILSIQSDFGAPESAGRVTVTIGRSAGSSGAVSVEYSTRDLEFNGLLSLSNLATAGLDYRPTSGRLDWASGDTTDRSITIDLVNDTAKENPEYFQVRLSNATGGGIIVGGTRTVPIDDDDTPADGPPTPAVGTPTPAPATSAASAASANGGGGGGALAWQTLAALVATLLASRGMRLARARPPPARGSSTIERPQNPDRTLTLAPAEHCAGIRAVPISKASLSDPIFPITSRALQVLGPCKVAHCPSLGGFRMSTHLRQPTRRRFAAFLAALRVALLLPAIAGAGIGDLDPSYGPDGHVQLAVDAFPSYGPAAVAPDGSLLVGWRTNYLNYDDFGVVYRLGADGRLDPLWGTAGRARFADPTGDLLQSAALQPDGRLLVAGAWGAYVAGGAVSFEAAVARLRSDGSADPGFGSGGVVRWRGGEAEDHALRVTTLDDGRLVAAYEKGGDTRSCQATLRLKRFFADGRPDPDFGQRGDTQLRFDDANCNRPLTLQPLADGRLLVASSGWVYRLRADGNVDPAAPAPRIVATTPPWTLAAARRSGELLLAGTTADGAYASRDGGLDLALTRLRADGTRDASFGTAGDGVVVLDLGRLATGLTGVNETLDALLVSADGQRAWAAVRLWRQESGVRVDLGEALARLGRYGRLDPRFGAAGIVRLARKAGRIVIALGEQPSGALLVAYVDGVVLRLLADGHASPGAVQLEAGTVVTEGRNARATLVVTRVGGSDGPLAVDWSTWPMDATALEGTRGGDFVATGGRLEWIDGDDSDRRIEIEIVDDQKAEFGEAFQVELSGASSGALVLRPYAFVSIIDDDRVATAAPTAPAPTAAPSTPASSTPPAAGGSGALQPGWLLFGALLSASFRRRRVRPDSISADIAR